MPLQKPLLVAIEPDQDQASRIADLARDTLRAELIVTDSAEGALKAMATRLPDLILTPQLLAPQDEAALMDRLRELDAAGKHVQTLVVPMLAETGEAPQQRGGLLSRLRRQRKPSNPDGCDPAVFGAQIVEYLKRAASQREAAAFANGSTGPAAQSAVVAQPSEPVVEIPVVAEIPPVAEITTAEDIHAIAAGPAVATQDDSVDVIDTAASVFEDSTLEELSAALAAVPAMDAVDVVPEISVDTEPELLNEPFHDSLAADADAEAATDPGDFDDEMQAELEAMFAAVPAVEPLPAPPPDLPEDMLEMLTGIQREIELLRSAQATRPRGTSPASSSPAAQTPKRKKKAAANLQNVQDEWGFFDPEQAGFAALLAKLEEISQSKEPAAAARD
jgi:hypothetical protein